MIGPDASMFKGSGNKGASLLEHGGTVRGPYTGKKAVFRNGRLIKRGDIITKKYKARPYMAPALVKMAVDLRKKYPTEIPRMFNIATAGI